MFPEQNVSGTHLCLGVLSPQALRAPLHAKDASLGGKGAEAAWVLQEGGGSGEGLRLSFFEIRGEGSPSSWEVTSKVTTATREPLSRPDWTWSRCLRAFAFYLRGRY